MYVYVCAKGRAFPGLRGEEEEEEELIERNGRLRREKGREGKRNA